MYDTELMAATGSQPGGSSAGPRAGPPGAQGQGLHLGHWYDEPPYESDPEDFLMTVPPGAMVPNGRYVGIRLRENGTWEFFKDYHVLDSYQFCLVFKLVLNS